MWRLILVGWLALAAGGCASYAVVENAPRNQSGDTASYSIQSFQEKWKNDPNVLMLAFSGGGTRAAALTYGVLRELKETRVPGRETEQRLLDHVHSISSVSGGSFTAAYYGLHGDRLFEDFETVFLRQNIQGALVNRLLNPLSWFSSTGRTEMAVKYYEDTVFKGATFADLRKSDGPMVIINASDFAAGVRFSFLQEYFDLLCSDLDTFSVARAVTASSAVPILFNPVVLENYPDCGPRAQQWLDTVHQTVQDDPDLLLTVEGLESYTDRENRKYIHFVDGGISDNLGLRAFYEFVELNGGVKPYTERYQRKPPQRLVLISVNAATESRSKMDQTTGQPSLAVSINAMSDVQLRRYSADTIALMKSTLKRWASDLSTPEQTVEPYFILLNFAGVQQEEVRDFLNQTPTSFNLTDEQVDRLISAGGELLRGNAEFKRLMKDVDREFQKGN